MMRIGLVGAGFVTRHHLIAWRGQHPRAKVVAIADPIVEKAQGRAREFDIPAVFSSAAQLLDDGAIDALDVASPRETHAEVVLLAAERGIPVLCQKPLAPNLAEARRVVAAIGARIPVMIHENWRFRRYYREAKRWLDAGVAGRMLQARMTVLSSGLIPDATGKCPALERQPFMRTLDRMLVMEVLIHHLDTLRFLLGTLTVAGSRIGRASPEIRGEDSAMILLATASGAPVVLHGNMAAQGYPPALVDRMDLFGDRATIALEHGRLTATGGQRAEARFDLDETYQESYNDAIAHFVDTLLSGDAFETGLQDNLGTLEIVEQIYALDGR